MATHAGSTVLCLRTKQTDAIIRMLNLNHNAHSVHMPQSSAGTGEDEVYKVLVLDRFCRDILSPLLRVNDLRKHGITLHLLIDSDRQEIPDVPGIYFVQPTNANIERIVADASSGLYDHFYLNFSSSLPRVLLENLAAGTVRSESVPRVKKIFDQYLNFLTLEEQLFTLGHVNSYQQLNDPTAQDRDVESAVETIVSGLFCVLVTVGTVPIIRAAKGGVAEMVANLLHGRLRDHLSSRHNLFADVPLSNSSFQRPLLILMDRNFDLGATLQHHWTYQPMVHDILGLKLNRVVILPEPPSTPGGPAGGHPPPAPAGPKKSYELDESDPFWVNSASSPFPKVAEEVEMQLNRYKMDVEEVNRKASGKPAPGKEKEGEIPDDIAGAHNTKALVSLVNSLPELTDRKRVIDKHTNVATALLAHIKRRQLDAFCSLEEDLLTKSGGDLKTLMSLLSQPAKGTPEDKLRAAIVYILATEAIPPADMAAIEEKLGAAGAELSALRYVQRMKSLNFSIASATAGSRGNLLDWADKLYGQSLTVVTEGMKKLLSTGRQLALTRIVEALMDGKVGNAETDGYLMLDPRAPKAGAGAGSSSGSAAAANAEAAARNKGPFREAIVFMIGGGNYRELLSMKELASKSVPLKSIAYGTTELLTGEEFLAQLTALGRKLSVQQ